MKNGTRNLAQRMLHENEGTSVVELALVLPIFLLLLAGSTDLASAFSKKLLTQQAAARTMELATSAGIEAISLDGLRAEGASGARVPVSKVFAERWLECAGTKQPNFEGACTPGEETARFVGIRIQNEYAPVLGPLLPARMTQNGVMAFTGSSSVRLQ